MKSEKRDHFIGINGIYGTLLDIVGIEVPDRSAQDSVSFASYISSSENTDGLH